VSVALWLSLAASVAVADSAEIAARDVAELVHALDAAIARRIGEANAKSEPVSIRVFGGLTVTRVIADRGEVHAEIDVPIDRELWIDPLEALASKLFPEGTWSKVQVTAQDVVPLVPPAVVPKQSSIAPWIVFSASAIVLGAGIAFGISSRNARNASQVVPPAEDFDRLADRAQTHGITADVLFFSATAGAVAGIWLLLDD
jgi:hypothetical protein